MGSCLCHFLFQFSLYGFSLFEIINTYHRQVRYKLLWLFNQRGYVIVLTQFYHAIGFGIFYFLDPYHSIHCWIKRQISAN